MPSAHPRVKLSETLETLENLENLENLETLDTITALEGRSRSPRGYRSHSGDRRSATDLNPNS